jgi:DNA primase
MAVLCEGQLDAIAFHRAGFDCAVAPLGTAFTPEQAKIIHRYSRNLILAFDADGAGKKAVLRAAEILLPLSVDLRVLQIPGGKDPDELFSHGGKDAVADALAHTVGWMEILKNTLPERFDLASPVGRSQAAAFVASFIRLVNNEVELEVYTKEAAKMLEISENAMKAEISGASVLRSYTAKNDQLAQVPPRRRNSAAMLTLLELAIADSNCGRAIAEQVSPELIPGNTPVEMALNLAINAALNDEMTALEGQLKDLLITQPSPEVSKALYQPTAIVPEKRQRALAEAIKELLDSRKRKSQSDLLTKLREAVTDEEKMQILAELQNSTQQQERNPGI